VANRRASLKPFESEVALIITNKAEDLVGDIAGLTSIHEYDLKPEPPYRIRDTYYDTKLGLLRKRKTTLRIRRTDGNTLVSMKSNPQRLDGQGVRRVEIEAQWSQQSFARILEVLKNSRSPRESHFFRNSASNTFASMGLVVIQKRMTRRVVRGILRHDREGSMPVAEMDVDSVTYLGDPKIRVFQVEIEAKARGSVKRIQEIAETLLSTYSGFLKEWPYGKLATGMAIQRLLKSGALQSHLDHGRLKAEAFRVIERDIVSTNPQ
jgi:triphosphatase